MWFLIIGIARDSGSEAGMRKHGHNKKIKSTMRGKGRYAYQFPVIPGTGTPSDERCP